MIKRAKTSDYVAYGIHEDQGLIKSISIIKSDGMSISTINEQEGYLVIGHTEDMEADTPNRQTIKIHPADFIDFYEMVNEAANLFHQRKCHWQNSLCNNEFKCLNCELYV